MPQITEFQLQRAVCLWLDGDVKRGRPGALRPGVIFWHTPNGGKRGAFEAKRFKEMGVKPGVHDLLFLANGLYGLELKAEGEHLSPAQIAMHPRLLAAGMVASAVADTLAAAKAQIVVWGLAI